jgi:sortase A
MRFINHLLFIIGIACLGTYVVFTVQSHIYQHQLDAAFDAMVRYPPTRSADRPVNRPNRPIDRTIPHLSEGDLVGRLEIPRLDLSVMVLEGVASRTLRLGAGHIPGTAFPGQHGNFGIAAHRDSFFRALSKIEPNDRIRFETVDKVLEYRVVDTEIVKPDDVSVLDPGSQDTLTLVTCYPFYYIGPAPKRFVVTATAATD